MGNDEMMTLWEYSKYSFISVIKYEFVGTLMLFNVIDIFVF